MEITAAEASQYVGRKVVLDDEKHVIQKVERFAALSGDVTYFISFDGGYIKAGSEDTLLVE